METLFEFGLQFIAALQNFGESLRLPMDAFSFLGSEQFFLLAMPFLYWCVDTALGGRIGLILLLGNSLNSTLKLVFHTPRPFWYTREVRAFAFESSFGIPSGHAQNSAAVFGMLAYGLKRGWVTALALLFVILIGLSRIYLAVHFPHDVLVGWLIGFVVLWLYIRVESPVKRWLGKSGLWMQVLAALGASLILIGLGVLAGFSLQGWQLPVEWVENAKAAFPDETINPFSLEGLVTSSGALFGFAAGMAWLGARGGMNAGGAWWLRGLRFVIGISGVLLLWAGLDIIFPEGETLVAYAFRYLRYSLVGLWVGGIAPLFFIRLGLAKN